MTITRKFPVTLQERLDLGSHEQRFPGTLEEFADLLAVCDYPIEYQEGEIIARSIAGDEQEQIVANLLGILYILFKENPEFKRYGSNRHIFIPEFDVAFSPDATIVKGEPDSIAYASGKTANRNPWLIAEVLSDSTRRRDWGEKLPRYRKISSLHYILFIEQDSPFITVFERATDSPRWTGVDYNEPHQSFTIAGQEVRVGNVYENISFEEPKK